MSGVGAHRPTGSGAGGVGGRTGRTSAGRLTGRSRAMARAMALEATAVQEPLFEVEVRPERRYFRQMLDALTRSGFGGEALAAEATVSKLFGTVWSAAARDGRRDGAEEEAVGLGLVEYARHRYTPTALALLRTLAVVAPIHEVRMAATRAADGLAAGGVPEPAWSPPAGAATPGRCWTLSDVFGDESLVVCEFGYGGDPGADRHGIAIQVDHVLFSAATSAVLLDDIDAVVRDLRNHAARHAPMWTLRQVDPAWARGVLTRAFARTDLVTDVAVADDYAGARALAMARVAALPEPADLLPAEPAFGPDQWTAVVAEFLASEDASGLTGSAASIARMIAEFSADRDPGQIIRVGPRKWETFLFRALPERGLLAAPALAPVVRAWSAWAARAMALPRPAAAELAGVLDEMLTEYLGGAANRAVDR